MDTSKKIIIAIIAVVIVVIGAMNKTSNKYKDAETLAEAANNKRNSIEYLSYDAQLKMLGSNITYNVKVYRKGNDYRFETPTNVALSKLNKIKDTKTNVIKEFNQDNSLYNIIKITNITYNKYFHNRYAKIGKDDKIGEYNCTNVEFNPRSPKYKLCYEENFGLPVKTTVGMKNIPIITLIISNISDNKFDENILSNF